MNKKIESTGAKRELEEWEECKKTVLVPRPSEVKRALFLSDEQFRQLLGVDRVTYSDLMSGSGKGLTHSQKLFLYEVIKIAKEKGIVDENFGA